MGNPQRSTQGSRAASQPYRLLKHFIHWHEQRLVATHGCLANQPYHPRNIIDTRVPVGPAYQR